MAYPKTARRVPKVRRSGALGKGDARLSNARTSKQAQVPGGLSRSGTKASGSRASDRKVRVVVVAGRRFAIDLDQKISERLGRVRQSRTKPEQETAMVLRELGLRSRRSNAD